MKEKSVEEKQVMIMEETTPNSSTPNLDKIQGVYKVTPCKKSWLQEVNRDYKDFAVFDKAEICIGAPRIRDSTYVSFQSYILAKTPKCIKSTSKRNYS